MSTQKNNIIPHQSTAQHWHPDPDRIISWRNFGGALNLDVVIDETKWANVAKKEIGLDVWCPKILRQTFLWHHDGGDEWHEDGVFFAGGLRGYVEWEYE